MMTLTWATQPVPANNMNVSINLPQPSWTNPPAVGEITCDVFLGTTEPNLLDPDYGLMTLATGISGNTVTLPSGLLQPNTTYYWVVDVHDSIRGTTRGYVWTFNTSNAIPSVVLESRISICGWAMRGAPASRLRSSTQRLQMTEDLILLVRLRFCGSRSAGRCLCLLIPTM